MPDIRDKSVQYLAESLAAASGGQDGSSIAAQLEEQIHGKHGDTSNDYRAEIRDTGLTLKKDNPQLAAALLSGSTSASQVAAMSFEEMKTDKQAAQDQELRQQNLSASIGIDELDTDPDSATNLGGDDRPNIDPNEIDAEGDFKARAQPKVGESMRGIEFETGQ